MIADLHIHTYFSDGAQSPEEITRISKERGLSIISVCDHNTITAYDRLRTACLKESIQLVQGVELDVKWGNKSLHLLAYNFDPDNAEMLAMITNSRKILDDITIDTIIAMEPDYPCVSLSDYIAYTQPLGRGGWKGINYFFDKGLSDNVRDAMKYGRMYYKGDPQFYQIDDACRIIKSAGGVPVVAHPGVNVLLPGVNEKQDPDIIREKLSGLLQSGIEGVECYYPGHDDVFTDYLIHFCKANGLCITCGGDGHGIFSQTVLGPSYDIGTMRVDIKALVLEGIL